LKPLGVAIVGAGRMGWIFARAVTQLTTEARVSYAISRSASSAKKMGMFFDCPHSVDIKDALTDPNVNAVIIAATTPAHTELALACIAAHKPFFIEKPIADTLENGRLIIQALNKNPVPHMVGFQRRFDLAYVQAKQHIDAGGLGKLEIFRSISRDPNMDSSSLEFHLNSGGLIVDLGVHDMDLARWLMGEVLEVQALGGALTDPSLSQHNLHDTAVAILRFESGAFGTIEMARSTAYGHEVRTEVLGAKGKISIERDQRGDLKIYDSSGANFDRPRGFEERFAQAYIAEITAFIRGLQGQQTLTPNAVDAWYSQRLAMAAQTALDTGKTIQVSQFGGDVHE
jgi:predicted dehydrogenase